MSVEKLVSFTVTNIAGKQIAEAQTCHHDKLCSPFFLVRTSTEAQLYGLGPNLLMALTRKRYVVSGRSLLIRAHSSMQ